MNYMECAASLAGRFPRHGICQDHQWQLPLYAGEHAVGWLIAPVCATDMQIPHVSTTSHQIGRQLAELDREIHAALKDIRRNLVELEEVSHMGATDRPGRNFADVLKETMGEGGSASA